MPKSVHDDVLDAALNVIKDNADRVIACTDIPANYAGVAAVSLADVAVDTTDFTIANGDVSGRKITVAAQPTVPVDATGEFDHLVIVDDTGSRVLLVTTGTAQTLTAGNTANFPAFDYELPDPA